MFIKDGYHKALTSKTGDDAYILLGNGGHKKLTELLESASLGASGNSTTLSITVAGTTKTGSVTVPYATKAGQWYTARAFKIGDTSKNIDGTGNVTWTLNEIGVYSKSTSDGRYVYKSGDTMTGALTFTKLIYNWPSSTAAAMIVLKGAENYGIWYHEGDPDKMMFSASGNANNASNADFAINGAGNGTLTCRGNIILHAGNYTTYTVTKTGGGASGTWSINVTGNAGTATTWQTARTLTIGGTGKSVNGSANVSWSLDEIGVYSKSTSDGRYVYISGDWMNDSAQLYWKGINGSTSVYTRMGYYSFGSTNMPTYAKDSHNNTKAFYIMSNGYDAGNDWGGLSIDDEGVSIFGAGDAANNFTGIFRVFNEDNFDDGPQFIVTKGSGATTKYVHNAQRFVSSVGTGTQPYACSSKTVNTNLNADMTDGLHVHTGRNNEANKLVRTDGSGYIQAGWINTISGDMGTTAIDRVYCSNDGYIRYKTKANFVNGLDAYWANVKVSSTSNSNTQPNFADIRLQKHGINFNSKNTIYQDGIDGSTNMPVFAYNTLYDGLYDTVSYVEYYNGSSWVAWQQSSSYDFMKPAFNGLRRGNSVTIDHTHRRFRVITGSGNWCGSGYLCFGLSWWNHSTMETSSGTRVPVKVSLDYASTNSSSATFTNIFSNIETLEGPEGYYVIPCTIHNGKPAIRLTIEIPSWANTGNSTSLHDVVFGSWFGGESYQNKQISRLYWANLNVQTSTSTTTTPQFARIGLGAAVNTSYSVNAAGTILSTSSPGFANDVSSGWSYIRIKSSTDTEWHVGSANNASFAGGNGSFEIRDAKSSYSGISIRRNTSSYGKLVVTAASGEVSVGLRTGTSGNPQWVFGIIDATNYRFGFWNTANSVWRANFSQNGYLYLGDGNNAASYRLHVVGDGYSSGWFRAASGFYVHDTGVHFTHQGTVGEIDMTSNNEFLWGASSSTLHFNYRAVSRGTTVTNYVWNAGSSTSYATHTTGLINVRSQTGSYSEGIRIYPYSSWTTIILGGNDLTAASGTSVNSWSIHNNNGNFYINKNNSSSATVNRLWARTGGGFTFGNTGNSSYVIESAGDIRTATGWFRSTGNYGWYNDTYGGGWYMTDSTYVRVYNNKSVYNANTGQYAFYTAGGFTGNSLYLISSRSRFINLYSTLNHIPPFSITGLKSFGYPVYNDPEFASGYNSVSVYNNSGGGTVTITREASSESANSSGYQLKIVTNGKASPGAGGFVQSISSRANAVFVQIFRAKIPTGWSVYTASNSMGSSYSDDWLTEREGTGKWEWYARIVHCGSSGTFSGGGHVYLSGTSNTSVTWYLSYCNVIDITKGNYDGLRTRYSDNTDSLTNPGKYYWANISLQTSSNTGTTPQFGYVGINVANTSGDYRLRVNGYSHLSYIYYTPGNEVTDSKVSDSAVMVITNGSDAFLRKGTQAAIRKYVRVPWGFNSWSSGATWGNTTGTSFATWGDSTGGSIDFRRDNPSSGKMSIKVDGRVYVNEGTNPCLSAVIPGDYWAIRNPDGGDTWIKTTTNGFLPYTSGGEWAGHSSLGTSSWYFGNIYTQYLNDIHIRRIAVNNSTAWATNFDTEVFGAANNTNYKLSILRMNSNAPTHVRNNYATGIAWKGSDTKGVMSVAYNTPAIRWAGGSGTNNLTWWMEITGTNGVTYNLEAMRTHTHQITINGTAYTIPNSGTVNVGYYFKYLGWNNSSTYANANSTSQIFGLIINQQGNDTSHITNYPTSYGYLLSFNTDSTTYTGVQLYGGSGNDFYIRDRWSSSAWNTWQRIVVNSGTWSINVTGSAGSVAWANVTSKPPSTGSSTQPVYWNGSTFVACTAYSSASVNYATKAGSAPASDVYAWAKASTKPSYSFSEITPGAANIGDGAYYMRFRTNGTYESGIYYHTTGNEALVFANKSNVTSWIFANTSPSGRADWTTLSPGLQIKNKSVYINSLIGNGVTPSYNFYVNGTSYMNGNLTMGGGNLTIGKLSTNDSRYIYFNTDTDTGDIHLWGDGHYLSFSITNKSSGQSGTFGILPDHMFTNRVIKADGGFIHNSYNSSSYVLLSNGGASQLKTINGTSIFGSGNITISGGGGNYLPLSGGTLSGNLTMNANITMTSNGKNSRYLSFLSLTDGANIHLWGEGHMFSFSMESNGVTGVLGILPDHIYTNKCYKADGGFIHNSYNSSSYVLLSNGGASQLKTINGTSIFGSGNITISGGGGSASSVPWTGVTDVIQAGNEFNVPDSGYSNSRFWFNYLPRNTRSNNGTAISEYHFGNLQCGYASLYAAAFYTTSDATKKKNITQFSDHIYRFTYKESNKDAYGVIAQNVEEMFRDGDEGNMKVNYDSVLSYYVGLLENEIKNLKEENSNLKTRIEDLYKLISNDYIK